MRGMVQTTRQFFKSSRARGLRRNVRSAYISRHKSENNSPHPRFCLIFRSAAQDQSLCDFGREMYAIVRNRRAREIMQMITEGRMDGRGGMKNERAMGTARLEDAKVMRARSRCHLDSHETNGYPFGFA